MFNCFRKNKIYDESITKTIVNEQTPNTFVVKQSLDELSKYMKEGMDEFELKNGRPMTYAEMRMMYG